MSSPSIPRIIHQIWIQGEHRMPLRYRWQAKTWRSRNPTWEYRLWDDADLLKLIRNSYPELLPVYQAYEHVMARSDIGRYALLHAFGGVYVDSDTMCVRPIERYLAEPDVSLYVQVYDNPAWNVSPEDLMDHVSNAFIACSPAHEIFDRVFEHFGSNEHPQPVWIAETGPEMYQACLAGYLSDHDDVRFLTKDRIVTAYYLPRHYMRWYAWRNRDVFALHHNDSARREWHPSWARWLWPSS